MGDKAKLVTPEEGVKDDDVIIHVRDEGENGAVELGAMRTNKGRAATQITCCEDDSQWLACMEDQFQKRANADGKIQLEDFKDVLGVRQSFFAERFFDLFDKEKKGNIEVYLLLHGLRTLAKGTSVEKLKFVFDVYDIDGSGKIEREELKTILTTCMEESSLFLGEDHLNDLTDVMFDAAGKDRTGSMTFDDLRKVVEKHPSILENLTLSATQWLTSSGPPKREMKGWRHKFTWTYFRNNLRKILFVVLFAVIQLIITIYTTMAVLEKSSSSTAYTVIRIFSSVGGMLLNFNCMFVLVLVLRKCHSLLRSTPLAAILPLDQHITFHKMVGAAIGVSAAIHVGGHISHAIYVQTVTPEKNMTAVDILFTQKAKMGWVAATAYITGWPILGILIIMTICSLPFVRRGGHFEVFYWTHMLYIPFWILLIIHAEVFWYYLIGPLIMFIIEKIMGSRLMRKAQYGDIHITEVGLLPSGVCHLVLTRPDNFRYRPGDYIFLQIPVIANFEWHPFTISSAPELKGQIWLHVRTAGHWTKQLYEYFSALDPIQENPDKELKLRQRKSHARASWWPGMRQTQYKIKDKEELKADKRIAQIMKRVNVKCRIDGPYGTATREIFETEHAVLIGAGIGVTPMASILQSIMYRYKESKRICPNCNFSFYGVIPESVMKLKKVNFIWINRDQKSFEWFVGLLNKIEKEQIDVAFEEGKELEKVIDIQLYMTAAKAKTDIRGAGLQMALSIIHRRDKKDLITGLSTRTQAGRPNWNEVFTRISEERKGRVKVFFCGAPQLGQVVKKACMKFDFRFRKENF